MTMYFGNEMGVGMAVLTAWEWAVAVLGILICVDQPKASRFLSRPLIPTTD